MPPPHEITRRIHGKRKGQFAKKKVVEAREKVLAAIYEARQRRKAQDAEETKIDINKESSVVEGNTEGAVDMCKTDDFTMKEE